MANGTHLEILHKGAETWNVWREESSLERLDLTGAELRGQKLHEVNFGWTDLAAADLGHADLRDANLSLADLTQAKLRSAHLAGADLSGARLRGADLSQAFLITAKLTESQCAKASFSGAWLSHAQLKDANLNATDMSDADLSHANLLGTDLRKARLLNSDLSAATMTGAKLWGTSRDGWKIDGIECDYIFWDEKGEVRTPRDRDFKPGEFGELYEQLPTLEYCFEHGFTPLDVVLMDRVVREINARHREFELRLDSFHARGTPRAAFTVLHKEVVEETLIEISAGYEARIKELEDGRREDMLRIIQMLASQPKLLASRDIIISVGQDGDINVANGSAEQRIHRKIPNE